MPQYNTKEERILTPRQSLYVRGSAGDPLPMVYKAIEDKGVILRRGQLCLVCAGPGTGKSAFVLDYAVKSGVNTMYFSADSDAFTQLTRMVSMMTGNPLEKSAGQVRNQDLDPGVAEDLDQVLIRFNYNASPSLDTLENSMEAYYALYEDYPSLIVVDNITNVRTDSAEDDPFAGLESLMDYLHTMSRDTGACVIGLHHVTGPYNDADKPIPMSGVKGQITRVPELVLTLHRVSEGFGYDSLNVSAVKNRGGKSDASGSDYAELQFVGDTMRIADFD
ncbi:DnaB-like dsDNA helicase [Gordonia phage Switzerland]|uniref:DnaB-like replicative helicase n=1 Tax=Gordonia phage Rosalind TaxID=1838077 RepID=UPI0007B64268|nr:DnaB-like replicative helicase [Gordonia phage Rosalind]ASZ73953.1 DnaB-like dsDNA helicase [Gordonia phage ShayRa]AXH47872.1 DnaB-like dsDNA helicase [Gordonia phage LastResort]QDM56251.1 DnaB-like dsDNA helicase [Gordonia phage ReMo]QFP95141.1 DnaB-like dsDNA helicase [Gordonia phage MinecraftSteve]QLF84945.1 DnaB-like dsDNA helicase [Gordonia phage Epsocamisio]QWS67857.1 DnaB-like dsDNA helicase [Gordonia phage DekHockey33]QZD98724.1 DnaB-like dsDNA helicase [Gordonia phage Looper]UAJ